MTFNLSLLIKHFHTLTHTCTHIHMYTHTHTYTCTLTHTYTHTHVHSHIYTHTHTAASEGGANVFEVSYFKGEHFLSPFIKIYHSQYELASHPSLYNVWYSLCTHAQ